VRHFRYRALITLDPVHSRPGTLHPPARHYANHTRALVVKARPLRADGGPTRYFPAEIWQDDEEPLDPGNSIPVTVRVIDDRADDYLAAGQQFILWSGGPVGHGIVYRKVFTDHGPS